MVWEKLVSIFGTFFLVCACISLLVYIVERINFRKKLKKMKFSSNKKNLAIITGASSGLGRDYANFFCQNRDYGVDQLIIIARRKERLDQVKEALSLKTTVYPMDMTKREEMAAFKIFLEEKIQNENLEIKYLINSAGSGIKGESLDLGSEKENETADINCQAQVSMIHIVANLMREGGNIIQIASVAGFSPIGYLNAYAASKAFIYTYSRGLRGELLKRGINVTTVCPYRIKDTEFIGKAKIAKDKLILPIKSKQVVEKSMKDAKRGFALCTPGLVATLDRIFCGLIPDEILVYLTRLFV
jgi:short-subunit dehydrogenase